jgi:hypothetical protein
MLVTIAAASSIGAAVIWWRAARPRAHRAPWALAGLAAASVAAHRWMLTGNVELIHFPQYALLTGLLVLGGLGTAAAWVGGVAAGVADEVYQHAILYAHRPDTYLDFNDMVLNAIGTSWAALLLPARPKGHRRWPQRGWPRRALPLAGGVLGLALLYLHPPELTPFLRPALTGRRYHVLSAGEALACAVVLWALVRTSQRKDA